MRIGKRHLTPHRRRRVARRRLSRCIELIIVALLARQTPILRQAVLFLATRYAPQRVALGRRNAKPLCWRGHPDFDLILRRQNDSYGLVVKGRR